MDDVGQRLPARAASGVLYAASNGRELQGRTVRLRADEDLINGIRQTYSHMIKYADAYYLRSMTLLLQHIRQEKPATKELPSRTLAADVPPPRPELKEISVQTVVAGDPPRRPELKETSAQTVAADVPPRRPELKETSAQTVAADVPPLRPELKETSVQTVVADAPPVPADEVPDEPPVLFPQAGIGGVEAGKIAKATHPIRQSGPAYKSLYGWDECRGRDTGPYSSLYVNGKVLSPEKLADCLKGADNLNEIVGRLRGMFGGARVEEIGPDREKLLLIDDTPICIKFGCPREIMRYKISLAYQKLLHTYKVIGMDTDPRLFGEACHIKKFLDGLMACNNFEAKKFLLERYAEDTLVWSLKAYFDNGPADELNAYAVGEYEDAEGKANGFAILKNPSFDNNGRGIKGNVVDLRAGDVLASDVEAVVLNGDLESVVKARTAGMIAGIGVSVGGDGVARIGDGKYLHVTPPPGANAVTASGPGDAASADAVMKKNLSGLSTSQLSYLRESIEARKKHLEASGDAFIGAVYRIVFPADADDMPLLAHINPARWMPPAPGDTWRGLSEAYKTVRVEVLKGNIGALEEMLGLVNGVLNSRS
ncbi:hypothetical protein ACFFJ7_07515 [Pseudochelatococcus lubricantis]|uniref:hypothetical protein n=1 Tax=Pseudochelatococcus lubricantis TaxID=1538102 RepID=UPI0035E992C5